MSFLIMTNQKNKNSRLVSSVSAKKEREEKLITKSVVLTIAVFSIMILFVVNISSFFFVLNLFDNGLIILAYKLNIKPLFIPFFNIYVSTLDIMHFLFVITIFLVIFAYTTHSYFKDEK